MDLTDGAREIRSLAARRARVDESDRVVRNLGGSLARSLPTMERIVINADAIMDQFRYESMDSVRRSLALAESMMESGRGASPSCAGSWTPSRRAWRARSPTSA